MRGRVGDGGRGGLRRGWRRVDAGLLLDCVEGHVGAMSSALYCCLCEFLDGILPPVGIVA